MIGLMPVIQLQQLLISPQQLRLPLLRRQRAGLLRRGNRVVKLPRFRVGRRQRAQRDSLLVVGQFTGALGVFDGLGSVANARIRAHTQ